MKSTDLTARLRTGAWRFAPLGLAVFVALLGSAAAQEAEPRASKSEDEVRKLLATFIESYNKADAEAIAALFVDDAVILGGDGEATQGRAEVDAHYQEAFAEGPTAKVVSEVDLIRFPTPEVGSLSGRFALVDEGDEVLAEGRFTLLAVRRGDAWKITELQDHSVEPTDLATSRSELDRLAWMVGSWVNEGEDIEVRSSVRWAEDGHFLVRTYSLKLGGVPEGSGTQWIGWDPQTRKIRSWVFDSQGGHGEGHWTESEGRWIVKASGMLGDGRRTTATQIIEPVGQGAIRFSSTDRIVGEEVQPDIEEVILVRQPPEPANAPATDEAKPRPVPGTP